MHVQRQPQSRRTVRLALTAGAHAWGRLPNSSAGKAPQNAGVEILYAYARLRQSEIEGVKPDADGHIGHSSTSIQALEAAGPVVWHRSRG